MPEQVLRARRTDVRVDQENPGFVGKQCLKRLTSGWGRTYSSSHKFEKLKTKIKFYGEAKKTARG
ncbi:protein of unknown function [Burkholderia multivorans]